MNTEIEKRQLDQLIKEYSKKYKFFADKIEIYNDDNECFGIIVDGEEWSNYLNYQDTVDEICAIFKGIEMANKYSKSEPDIIQFSVDVLDGVDEENIKTAIENAGITVVGISFTERWKAEEYDYSIY